MTYLRYLVVIRSEQCDWTEHDVDVFYSVCFRCNVYRRTGVLCIRVADPDPSSESSIPSIGIISINSTVPVSTTVFPHIHSPSSHYLQRNLRLPPIPLSLFAPSLVTLVTPIFNCEACEWAIQPTNPKTVHLPALGEPFRQVPFAFQAVRQSQSVGEKRISQPHRLSRRNITPTTLSPPIPSRRPGPFLSLTFPQYPTDHRLLGIPVPSVCATKN